MEHPLLRYLSDSEVAMIKAIAREVDFEAGDLLIQTGERSRDLVCIDSGSVAVMVQTPDGQVKQVSELGSGSLIGEMNFVIPSRRTADVVAVTPTRITVFPYLGLTDLLKGHPVLAAKIFQAINEALVTKYLNMLAKTNDSGE